MALTPVTASLAAVSISEPAGAAGTLVIAESFEIFNVSSPTSWVKPAGPPGGAANSACLTAGTDTTQTPIPGCSSSAEDPDGSGVLQLTAKTTQQEGGALTSLSVPASNGLDATFDTYQFGGRGADGIAFVVAAEDPSDPVAPMQLGEPGGDLGYSAGVETVGSGDQGLTDGYLGVGLDVYGSYSNKGGDGTGCPATPSWDTGSMPKQVVLRGPGKGTAGYCVLDSSARAYPGTSQDLMGSSRATSQVPVEVVLNTTSASVTMSGTQFAGDSVPAGDYGVAWVPLGGSAKFYDGPMPSTRNGGIPSVSVPVDLDQSIDGDSLPAGLRLGGVHRGGRGLPPGLERLGRVPEQVPVLSAAITDSDNGQLPAGGSVGYTLQAGVTATGGAEGDPIIMTATLPNGVTPGSAAGTGWVCTTAGQIVTCTYPDSPAIAAGTNLPPVSLPATVATDLAANTPLDTSLTVSSDDGDPATATDQATMSTPTSLTSVTLSATATSNPSAGSSSTPAGIGTIPLDNNGNLPTATQQSGTTGTSSSDLDGSPNAAVASTKVGAIKLGAIKVGAIKLGAIKVGAIKLGVIALGSQSQDTSTLQERAALQHRGHLSRRMCRLGLHRLAGHPRQLQIRRFPAAVCQLGGCPHRQHRNR